ncbi:dimethylhistidine N-methyltransferase [Rhodoblastus acidophilus]|uniref:Dimethylhistidine N-methyltransferase n=1 Tax=Rhodoblastus acidophilus TaxID=1074 RepID=A0A212RQM9_RHOAC|nr:L-histidine N(alpha)-methyltransferase [Rhodoblastus acidophilus]PPQ38539.1 L-histidine N(alpha)-methyltransferase [Rhodoblastus acidophilus]RAI21852.1 L-histidine N(alpha)-methyltransferase [Rhodoblastus acidophilus]SNB74782.1 dimethylhistidine N-methyltransferase [Rhodoblastus acidophilus]
MTDGEVRTRWDEAFCSAVVSGLSRPQKSIPCCWLYDERGSELFEAITRLHDYYPTRAEAEILWRHARDIADFCGEGAVLLEYGAGAGVKAEILIEALRAPRVYAPIDIEAGVLGRTARRIGGRFPGLDVQPILADFTRDFDAPELPQGPRAAFFPGSTIGNLNRREAIAFLSRMRRHVQNGKAVIGVDLKKDRRILLDAYDDGEGVTAAFNLNLLARINRELDGGFPLSRFAHEARWNEADSAVEMHLVSLDSREVAVAGRLFPFKAGDSIHTESSRKYELAMFEAMADEAGWRLARAWRDRGDRFAVFGLEALV